MVSYCKASASMAARSAGFWKASTRLCAITSPTPLIEVSSSHSALPGLAWVIAAFEKPPQPE